MTLTQREHGVNRSQIAPHPLAHYFQLDHDLLMPNKHQRTKNRSNQKRFLGICKDVLDSESYSRLGAWSVKLMVDIAKEYNGNNNGDLSATFSIMKKQGWRSRGTLHRAIKQLVKYGFLELTRQGGKNRCSLYAVTWKSIDECKGKLDVRETRVASNLWKEK